MRNLFICLTLLTGGNFLQGESSANQEMIEMQLQQLTRLDQQIENLVKQKVQLKAQAAAAVQRGADSILPREGKRADRSAEEIMQQIQSLNQQIEQLEGQREQVLMALE